MSTDRPGPRTTTPVRDYLDRGAPGATTDYLVLPRSLLQSMPLRWQQTFVGMLADLHDAYAEVGWPEYRVTAARRQALQDLDDEQLAAVGVVGDLDADGRLVFRPAGAGGDPDSEIPGTRTVLAPVPDPVPPADAGRVEPRPATPL